MPDKNAVQILPVLALKNSILFPGLLMPLSVGRPASLAAVEAALASEEKEILVLAQRDPSTESPGPDDLYTIGTKAVIRKTSRPSEDLVELLVLGAERVVVMKLDASEPFLRGRFQPLPLPQDSGPEVEALERALIDLAVKALQLAQPQQSVQELTRVLPINGDPMRLAFLLASMFSLDPAKEQKLLESETRADALRLMHANLAHEVQVLEIRNKISSDARTEMNKEQKDYMLRQQLRAIQQELGEKNSDQAETDVLRERV
ncbi:MAG: LON peptidase substrate-binding domain-containing protein, partial [Bryobacteraceae bacterium]